MGRTVRQLGEEMDSAEFTEWMAFYDLEPFGDDWRRTGQIASILHNVHRKETAEAVTAEAYMPLRAPEAEAPAQTGQQVLTIFRALAAQVDPE